MAEEREMDYPTNEMPQGEPLGREGVSLKTDQFPLEMPLSGVFLDGKPFSLNPVSFHELNGPYKMEDGEIRYYKDGLLHREGDLPAVIRPDGDKKYYKEGLLHRDGDKPAIEKANGTVIYAKEGKFHRDGDKPAYITDSGYKTYYKNGVEFRENGPAVVYHDGSTESIFKNGQPADGRFNREGGEVERYKNGKLHSEGEIPSVEKQDGTKMWHKEGELQKIERPNGEKLHFENGKIVPPPEMEKVHAGGKEQTGENRLEYKNGQYHVNDRPVEDRSTINGRFVREGDGDIEQYKNGKLHSEGDKPSIEKQDGTKMWHKEGELQKIERPNGEKLHFENGKMVQAPEAEKAIADGKEQTFSYGPQMKAGDLPIDSRNLHKDMVNAHEGKRSQEMQSKLDGAYMRQIQDTRRAIEHSQLMERAEATLKESGKTDGKVIHKDDLTGKTVEYNLKNGELHSNGKDPSFVIRDKHGQIERAEYHQNGNITKSWDRETGQMFHHAPGKAQEKEMQKPQPEKDNIENKNHSQETKAREETREEKLDRLKTAREEHQKQERTHDRGERR